MPFAPTDPSVRFERYVDTESGDCWLWTGSTNNAGYGVFYRPEQQKTLAHRFSLELSLGRPLTVGELACHSCDNPRCVNPAHLFVGTASDNLSDAYAKGRRRGWQSAKTHCKHGHPFTSDNTYLKAGKRQCRECARRSTREWGRTRRSRRREQ